MLRPLTRLVLVFCLVSFLGFNITFPSRALSADRPLAVVSPYDLINAVNTLRASYGLAPYSINSILMVTAQAQADFMAATEDVTHSGPGGVGLTDRLLAAGYPLAGDLSAGGFRAENISSGNEDRTAQSVIDGWSRDALHLNTMISPNLSEIGAGVAVANGRVYFVIDCALPTTVAFPQSATSELPVLTPEAPVVITSTPNADGDVIHEVQPGQSLWQLAIVYHVTIDEIKRLNNLLDDNIYPGNKLLMKQDVALPTVAVTVVPLLTSEILSTDMPLTQTLTARPTVWIVSAEPASSASVDDNALRGIAIGILVLALLGGGIFTWLGSKKSSDN